MSLIMKRLVLLTPLVVVVHSALHAPPPTPKGWIDTTAGVDEDLDIDLVFSIREDVTALEAHAIAVSDPSSPPYGDFSLDNSSWDKSDWHRDLFTQRLNEVAARVDPRTPEPLALARRRLERPSSPVAYGGLLDESSWDKSDWHRDLFAHRLNEVAARG